MTHLKRISEPIPPSRRLTEHRDKFTRLHLVCGHTWSSLLGSNSGAACHIATCIANERTMSAAHSPFCEINNISTTQEIPHILYEQNVRYRVHKSQISVSILNQFNTVQYTSSKATYLKYTSILSSHLHFGFPSYLTSDFLTETLVSFLHYPPPPRSCSMICSSQ